MLGTRTPQSVLSFQKMPLEVELENECECLSPRMHHLSRFIEDLHPLGACFVEQYLAKAKDCGDRYVEIEGPDGEWLPLKGLGTMRDISLRKNLASDMRSW